MLNMKKIVKYGCIAAFASVMMAGASFADAVKAAPGGSVNLVLLPKFLGILPFDQRNHPETERCDAVQQRR